MHTMPFFLPTNKHPAALQEGTGQGSSYGRARLWVRPLEEVSGKVRATSSSDIWSGS